MEDRGVETWRWEYVNRFGYDDFAIKVWTRWSEEPNPGVGGLHFFRKFACDDEVS